MKIIVTDASNGAKFTLCSGQGDVDPIGPFNLRIGEGRVIQEDEAIRALEKIFQDRKNRSNHFSFESVYLFETLSAAEEFMLDVGRQVPSMGNVTFTTDKDGGQITRVLNNCGIRSVERFHFGVTVIVSYQLIGGAIETV